MGFFDTLFGGSESKPVPFVNPANAPLLELLGLGSFDFDRTRGLRWGDPSALGRGLGSLGALQDVERFVREGGREQSLLSGLLGEMEGAPTGELRELGDAGLAELLQTGLRTDTDQIRADAMRLFERETVPAALEALSGTFGLQSTATQQELFRQARDLDASLAGLEFEAGESAAGRRAGALGNLGLILGQRAAGMAGEAELAQMLGQATDPGARTMNALLALSTGQAPNMMGQSSQSSPGILGQLGGVPGIAGGIADAASGLGGLFAGIPGMFAGSPALNPVTGGVGGGLGLVQGPLPQGFGT